MVHPVDPRASGLLHGDVCSRGGGGEQRATVAAILHSVPGMTTYTILAWLAAPKQKGVAAYQAVVMQAHDNRYPVLVQLPHDGR